MDDGGEEEDDDGDFDVEDGDDDFRRGFSLDDIHKAFFDPSGCFSLKTRLSEDDMEFDAEVLLNLEHDQAMQEDVAAEGSNNDVIIYYVIKMTISEDANDNAKASDSNQNYVFLVVNQNHSISATSNGETFKRLLKSLSRLGLISISFKYSALSTYMALFCTPSANIRISCNEPEITQVLTVVFRATVSQNSRSFLFSIL